MGGLIQDLDSHGQADKVPGLGDMPFLGRLFGTGNDQWNNRELVLVITPHIIRNNTVSEADLLELWSGTEAHRCTWAQPNRPLMHKLPCVTEFPWGEPTRTI